MKKFKIKIKCIQEMEMILPADAYGDPNITAEKIAEMEEENVMSDPTYFNFNENSTCKVEVDVDEVKDA